MKRLLRSFVLDTFSLFLVSNIATGIVFANGNQTLALAGLYLMLTSFLAKPVINLLLLPLNLLTFGLFRFVASAIVLYLVTLLVSGFKITSFNFPGFSSVWLDIPSISFEGFMAFIAFALLISLIASFLHWLVK